MDTDPSYRPDDTSQYPYSSNSNPSPPFTVMNTVEPPGSAPYREPTRPGGPGMSAGAYPNNTGGAYNPTLSTTQSPHVVNGAYGGSTAYNEKLYFHTKKLLTARVILKIVEIVLSFIYSVCISVLFPCLNPMGGFCMFTGWSIFAIAIFLFLVHVFDMDPIMPGPWNLIELIIMVVILVFLLVAEILSIVGAAIWPWGSIIVACIFGAFLFLVCIASVVVPFLVGDSPFSRGGGSGTAYPPATGRPVIGSGLGLPAATETNNQNQGQMGPGPYGGGYGAGYGNSGAPNQNSGQGSGSAYAAY